MVQVNPTQAKQLLLILKTGLNGKSWPKSASSYLTGGLKEIFFFCGLQTLHGQLPTD